jgi:hypothetical protein
MQVFFHVAPCALVIIVPRPSRLEYSATPLPELQISHSKEFVRPTKDW